MSTDAIFHRYLAAIQDATTLTDADLGAVRLGLRLALSDAQAACIERVAELSDIGTRAIAARAALATQVADLEQQLLRLQTLEDRLTAWLTHNEPAAAAQYDGDPGAAILHLLDRRRLVTVNVPAAAHNDNYSALGNQVANTIAAALPAAPNNGHSRNGGGATVAPPPTKPRMGRRIQLTDDELRARTVAAIRRVASASGKPPVMEAWNTRYAAQFNLPTVSGIIKRLNVKWSDLCAAALATSTSTTNEEEADHAPATFRS